MIDHASLVGKLRDIHPPLSDGFFEITTMTLLGAIAATGSAICIYYRFIEHQARFSKALKIIKYSRYHTVADRLALQARALREVAALTDPGTEFLHGDEWLSHLDTIFQTSFFSKGAGRIFGEELYKPISSDIIESLDNELSQLLARLRK